MCELISVVVPAYNIEKYLGRCLDSILAQTHKNLEIIVVNDGSADGTGAVIDEYAEKDVRVKAVHRANGGVTSARLAGIANATGEFIGFVDGDDFIEPDMYERLLKNALENGADISHCGYKMVFPDGHIDYYYNSGKLIKQDNENGVCDLLSGSFIEPGLVNKLYKKTLLDNLMQGRLMDTSIKINEDLLMNYYLFKESKLSVYEDFCPYHYILRKGSAATSAISEHKLTDPLKVLDIMLNNEKSETKAYNILLSRKAEALMINITQYRKIQPDYVKKHSRSAVLELRKLLPEVKNVSNWSKKRKELAFWAAYSPSTYRFVHRFYAKITGSAEKFKV